MRILHIITRLIQGGAQQNTVLSCAAQVKAGHEVHLAYGPIYGPEGSLLDEAKASGAILHEIASMRRAINPWHDIRCYRALRKLISDTQPDIIHTHSSKAGIVGRAAAWGDFSKLSVLVHFRTPDPGFNPSYRVIHTVHGLPFHDKQSALVHSLYVTLERWAAKRCHHLIAITPAMVDAFVDAKITSRDRFTVIPSGVDLSRFEVAENARELAREQLGIDIDAPVVLLLARLDPLKGHDDMLDILPKLIEQLPGIQLLFIGDGWRREHLEQRIQNENLSEHVHLLGFIQHEKMREVLPAADIKVLPSYQEGQSRTLIEALLCGCGIVAYNVGGIPSICIDGETGKLAPVGDKQALADAIVWMIQHTDERRLMIENGQILVREQFSADHMTRELGKLYERLLYAKHEPQMNAN